MLGVGKNCGGFVAFALSKKGNLAKMATLS